MCLRNKLTKEKKQEILDSIPTKGMKVYKVARVTANGALISPYLGNVQYIPGINVAYTKYALRANYMEGDDYMYAAGFHLFKSKDAAIGLREYLIKILECPTEKFIVIEGIVEKEWITEIGYEAGINEDGFRDEKKKEIVIVAKKFKMN